MSSTIREIGPRPEDAMGQPPAVLKRKAGAGTRGTSDGMRAGYGLDWLLVRADGRPADRGVTGEADASGC